MSRKLTEHLRGMADSLDESVTPEDVHRLLTEAIQMSEAEDSGTLTEREQAAEALSNALKESLLPGTADRLGRAVDAVLLVADQVDETKGLDRISTGHLPGMIRRAVRDALAPAAPVPGVPVPPVPAPVQWPHQAPTPPPATVQPKPTTSPK